jgi:predicted alpha/beta superfamily hydrolase
MGSIKNVTFRLIFLLSVSVFVLLNCSPKNKIEETAETTETERTEENIEPPVKQLSLPGTQIHELTSALGIQYVLYISTPRDYQNGDKNYPEGNLGPGGPRRNFPVVYLLDADFSCPVVRSIAEYLSDNDKLPGLILAGIAYPGGLEGDDWQQRYKLNRTRDYTPTHSPDGYEEDIPNVSGQADDFMIFLQSKAIPFVEENFRTMPQDRTIIGHSYGGLFGLYAIMKRPEIFSRAVLISPSIWYDDHFILGFEKSRRQAISFIHTTLFLSAGSKETTGMNIAGDVQDLSDLFTREYPAVIIKQNIFEGETHNTIFPAAVTRGLLSVFEN